MNLDELLEKALALGEEGDWEGMAELLRDELSEFEDAPAIHCWLGVAERELGMGSVAYERFKRALSLNPEDPYVLATAGNAVAAFDDPEAEQALRTAALVAPDVSLTRFMYGAYLSREGFVEKGIEELEAARDLDPDDPQIAYELGVAHYLAEDPAAAADALAEAVSLDRGDGWSRVVLGLVLLELERAGEAMAELMEGARLRPEDVEAQLAAALAASSAGEEDVAWEMLERGRMRALEGDQPMVAAVEERLDRSDESAGRFLAEAMAPAALSRRLQERP